MKGVEAGRVQILGEVVLHLEEGERCAGHLHRGAVAPHEDAAHVNAGLVKQLLYVGIEDVELLLARGSE